MAKKKATRTTKRRSRAPRVDLSYISEDLRPLARPIAELVEDPANARIHNERNLATIRKSLADFGQQKNIVIAGTSAPYTVIAGNGTMAAATSLGWTHLAANRFDDADDARAFALADNRTAELAEWDAELLQQQVQELASLDVDIDALGFGADELDELINGQLPEPSTAAAADVTEDPIPEPPKKPISKRGTLWKLGRHRVLCGDSTKETDVAKLLDGAAVDLVCTDPPYCSGGFQESGKSAGSVGRRKEQAVRPKQIANDRLSTRGFVALIKSALGNIPAPYLYCFTDWRMWIHLFDVAESSGYGVRSMIVCDKGTPGMGRGWRSQHELVLFGAKKTPPFDKHSGAPGNVIHFPRTGNVHHTTEKPVSVMAQLLKVAAFAERVVDPFAGSGTTLIAAEQLGDGRTCYALELDPAYCDVIVQRWEAITGKKAKAA